MRIVSDAARALPAAARILTGGRTPAGDPAATAAFLVEELALSDAEDAVAQIRAQLADPSALSPEDYEMLFETAAAMQRDLTARRAAHRPAHE